MELKRLKLPGGACLNIYLREASEKMPRAQKRPLVLVIPGGGYNHVSPREGDPVAMQLLAAGYHAAVLHYSVGHGGAQDYRPMRELNLALRVLRINAARWNILPQKIAVCGFSAGGHLALAGAVLDVPGLPKQERPNALILGYPVVTAGRFAHRGTFEQLAGSRSLRAQKAFTLEDKITRHAPPVFVWHTMEDKAVPVENTLFLVAALRRAGVPCEAHLFERGEHGTSISTAEVNTPSAHRSHWVQLAVEWLDDTFDYHV